MSPNTEGERIIEIFSLLESNIGRIPGIHILPYGSLRYGSLHERSDGDFFVVAETPEDLERIADPSFFQELFADESGGTGYYHLREGQTSPSSFPIEQIMTMQDSSIGILQVNGMVDLEQWTPNYKGILPQHFDVEFYATTLNTLKHLCLEPGGKTKQRYLSKPNEKGAGIFKHRMTERYCDEIRSPPALAIVDQEIEFLFNDGAIVPFGNGRNGTITLENASSDPIIIAYQKSSYGLPRVRFSHEDSRVELREEAEDPILIGVVGDKILSSMALTSDPNNPLVRDLSIPTWIRVAQDFYMRHPLEPFAYLLQRSYKFTDRFIQNIEQLYNCALKNELSPEHLMFQNTIKQAYTI